MIDGIEPLYQQIAESMIAAIPEEWSSARFDVFFVPGSCTYEAEFVRAADSASRSFQPTDDGNRAFRQLRKKFKEAGKRVWGRASFELRPDGKFNMKWGYDNCDENGDTIFNEEEEVRRHEARLQRLS